MDTTVGTTVYTVYEGALHDIEDQVYDAEQRAMGSIPGAVVRFRLLNGPRGDAKVLSPDAHCPYRRG
jgi:hypothetical protein